MFAPGIREIPRRVIIIELDVSDQRGPSVGALDEIVRQKRVLGELVLGRSLERVDIIDALPREAPLGEEILIDVGDGGRIWIDARATRGDRRKERAIRAFQ